MQELSYAMVTPYSMRKSRTGGIVARLISRTGLDIVAGRMFAPSAELVKRYAETIVTETESRHRATQELIREYVRRNFTGKVNGQRPRVLFLVFRGEDAVAKVHHTVGHIVNERTSGETIRDTFGDYIADETGKVTYFEPAVLTAIQSDQVERDLKLWAEFSDPKKAGTHGRTLWNSCPADGQARSRRCRRASPARKNASRLSIKARRRCKKFVKCWARPIQARRHRVQSEKNSAKPS